MTENTESPEVDVVKDEIAEVHSLLVQYRLLETTMRHDEMPPEEIEKSLAQTPCLVELRELLNGLPTVTVALILNSLSDEDRLVAWAEIAEERVDGILELLSEEISEELVIEGDHTSSKETVNAFELHNGRLRQIIVERPQQLTKTKPIWVDLVAPTPQVRAWVGKFFGLELPDPDELTDLEASARFYVDENDEVHLQSDFLLDLEDESRNVPVAFILHRDILFSVRSEELPVFRLQRLRARRQPGYVTDGKDVLLDLYAADAEYSADALEDVYAELEAVGRNVLNTKLSDEVAGSILADIAREEDLNGRIRRNVLDDRRAVSSLMRGKFLSSDQQEDARQILRDIESLDGHTSFLFGKINFLMDAVVGFINVNQNQRVSKLTMLGIIFMPINVLAGMGGMSEFSMMTQRHRLADRLWRVHVGHGDRRLGDLLGVASDRAARGQAAAGGSASRAQGAPGPAAGRLGDQPPPSGVTSFSPTMPATISRDAGQPGGLARLAEQQHAENGGADRADAGPHRIGGARAAGPSATSRAGRRWRPWRSTVATLGHRRLKPSVYFSPTAQPISHRPANNRTTQATPVLTPAPRNTRRRRRRSPRCRRRCARPTRSRPRTPTARSIGRHRAWRGRSG